MRYSFGPCLSIVAMPRIARLLCIWLLALMLPLQGMAAARVHCGPATAQTQSVAKPHGAAVAVAHASADAMPAAHGCHCPVDGPGRSDAPNDAPAGMHGDCCAAPCVLLSTPPTLQGHFVSRGLSFQPVLGQRPQFIPAALSRPPTTI